MRAVRFLAGHAERVRTRPHDVGPNVRANVEDGLRFTAADVARAECCRPRSIGAGRLSSPTHDVVITPTITITPRPWTELYPGEIDGKPTKSYFHWLALAYAVTLAGHPAVCCRSGSIERDAVRSADRGAARGRRLRAGVAAALEALLAGDARTARPAPDIEKLKGALPISDSPNFLGFD